VTIGRSGIVSVLAIALVASLLSIVAVAVRVTQPSTGTVFGAPDAPASSDGLAIHVLPGRATPLQTGDTVTAIAGRSVASWAETWLVTGDDVVARAGTPVQVEVVRNGSPLAVEVPLVSYPTAEMLVPSLGTLSFVFAMAAIGLAVFVIRPAVPASGALLLAGVGAAGSTVPFLLGSDPLDLATGSFAIGLVVTSFVYLLLWAGLLDFALVFPRPIGFVQRRPRMRIAPYAAIGGLYIGAVSVAGLTAPSTLAWLAAWEPLTLIPAIVVFVTAPVVVVVRWRRGPIEDRRILRGFALVMLAIVVTNAVIWVIPEALGGQPLIPWSVAAILGLPFPVLVAASIIRHGAFDIDVVIRRSLVYGGLTLGVVSTYAITAALLSAVLGSGSGFASSLVATGIAAIGALPLRDALQRATGRLVYGDRDEPVRAIRRLGERLDLVADPALLPRAVVDSVADALRLPYVALELGTGTTARIVAERGSPRAGSVDRPLTVQGRTVGRLLVANRDAAEPLSPADLRLLDDLCRQVAVAADAARLTDDLRASRERIVTAREEERRRLRRDLHDGLGPALAGIGLRAEAVQTLLVEDHEAAARLLAELHGETTHAVAEVRRLVDGLRPPAIDEFGLLGALRLAADRLRTPGGPTIEARVDVTLPALPAAVEVAAYRIALEALTNAIRHGAATAILLRIEIGADLRVVVEDDGRGFTVERGSGVGLASMHERAAELGGRLTVTSRPGGGSRVEAVLPVPSTDEGTG
jgi:signal transduction histidine kinase